MVASIAHKNINRNEPMSMENFGNIFAPERSGDVVFFVVNRFLRPRRARHNSAKTPAVNNSWLHFTPPVSFFVATQPPVTAFN
jgi:hypothetical protein